MSLKAVPDDAHLAVLVKSLEDIKNLMPKLFPWSRHLGGTERQGFVEEMIAAWHHYMDTGDRHALQETIEDWQATAETLSHGELADFLTAPREEADYIAWERAFADL